MILAMKCSEYQEERDCERLRMNASTTDTIELIYVSCKHIKKWRRKIL